MKHSSALYLPSVVSETSNKPYCYISNVYMIFCNIYLSLCHLSSIYLLCGLLVHKERFIQNPQMAILL